MPITRTPIIDDSGTGTDGTVIDNAWKQELYNQIDGQMNAAVAGIIDTPFVAGDYTGSGGMPWTVTAGNIQANWYQIVNGVMTWNITIAGSVTTGTPAAALNIRIPGGRSAQRFAGAYGKYYQAATGWKDIALTAAGTNLAITPFDNSNFGIDANTYIRFQIHIPV